MEAMFELQSGDWAKRFVVKRKIKRRVKYFMQRHFAVTQKVDQTKLVCLLVAFK